MLAAEATDSNRPEGMASPFVGLFQADDISDERILHFVLRGIIRTTSGLAYAASFVPQVGPTQGEKTDIAHRLSVLPEEIRRRITKSLSQIDLSRTSTRVIHTSKIGGFRVTTATISAQYNINLGSVVIIHTKRLSHRTLGLWLNIFEGIIAFRKEARALGHHRLLLELDKRQRETLDQSIGEIVHSAIHPNKTIIFVLDKGDIFRASYMSGIDSSALKDTGLHVGKGRNLLSKAYDTREPQGSGSMAGAGMGGHSSTGLETYADRHGYSSCLISPVHSENRCYCLVVCLFRRANAVSIVEEHIVESMTRLLSDYYRLWYRNHEVERSYAQADEVLRQVRDLLLIVDVLHDAAEDLVTARGNIGMLDPKTDSERETLRTTKAILNSLITATNHFKSLYRRKGRDVAESMSLIRAPFRPDRVSPASIIADIERKYRNQLSQAKIHLVNGCPKNFGFWGVEQCVKRAVENAVKNSIYQLQLKSHIHREIKIALREESVTRATTDSAGYTQHIIAIEISDNGPGISADLLATVRQRYVSHRGGMGLGVPIMEAACETHGGFLELASQWGKGFHVVLRFREMIGGD